MKNIIKTLVLLISFTTITAGCYAQRTISLRAFEILRNNYRDEIDRTDKGDDITYIKDVDNELDQFVEFGQGAPITEITNYLLSKSLLIKLTLKA